MKEIHRRGLIIKFVFVYFAFILWILYYFILFARCAIKNIQLYGLLKTLAGGKKKEKKSNRGKEKRWNALFPERRSENSYLSSGVRHTGTVISP